MILFYIKRGDRKGLRRLKEVCEKYKIHPYTMHTFSRSNSQYFRIGGGKILSSDRNGDRAGWEVVEVM